MKKTTTTLLLFLPAVLFCQFNVQQHTEKIQQQMEAAALSAMAPRVKKNFTLEEIWKENKFRAETVYGLISMKDGLHYTSLQADSTGTYIIKYSYKTGKTADTLVNGARLILQGKIKPIEIESYRFSADETKLLLATESEPIYRHSTKEYYYVYDIKSGSLTLLAEEKIRLAEFSPAGNFVAYVKDNNLFIQDISPTPTLPNEKGVSSSFARPAHPVTSDGKWNEIINGATDWVYEEEFSFDKAFFWSPDGKKIAWYRFDESSVKEFSMDMYGTLYPSQYRFKYPKAGEENAKVSIHLYNLETKQTLSFGDALEGEYLPRVKWTSDPDMFSVQRMNRHQNKLELLLADAITGRVKTILNETSETYIDITDDLTFLSDKKHFVITSEKSGFNHIYLYDINGVLVRQITQGNWDVTDFIGIMEKSQTVYYIAAEDHPTERALYSIKTDGTGKKKLSLKKGTNEAVFSEGYNYFINYHSDAMSPDYISLHDASGKEIRTLEENAALKNTLLSYEISEKEFFSFKTSANISLNGWMIKPPDFDSTRKYPVLMNVYGGPGHQTVLNDWNGANFLWYQHLAQKGYIIVSVDNRGTGARGAGFKKCTYKELGKLETIDQVEAAKYLGFLPYVDKSRIGIWGWSYGGYMSSLCITKGAEVFKTAIAVAPVTNWRFYDSIYTERYMQTPQENPKGYDDNSPINHVDKLKGKYLLIHGTADDNVHFQNSVEMVNALVKANKQFDLFFYPDKNHGIYGGNARLHLYSLMTDYILENL